MKRHVLMLAIAAVSFDALAQDRSKPLSRPAPSPVRRGPAAELPAGWDMFTASLGAFDFGVEDSVATYEGVTIGNAAFLIRGSGPGIITEMLANVHLPTGVVIDTIELDACDLDASQDVTLFLSDCLDDFDGPGGCTVIGSAGTSGTIGCTYVTSDPIGVALENTNHDYILEVAMPNSPNAGFRGVRIYYHLQVSPAPQTATFNDVPASDPAFQFIEAFAAAGITAGCSGIPPLYCPDANVTRRQMAVFFAKALGLRWPG